MYPSVYDFKSFYNSRAGRVVRRVVGQRVRSFWPDLHGLRLMGGGYAVPYLRMFMEEADRVFAVMPAGQGAHHWPQTLEEHNRVCLAEETELPFETSSIDRVMLVHDLEFSEMLRPKLHEIWRVLKPNGRVLVIVPNRMGLWARAEWSPFGLGSPYSMAQICQYLQDNLFTEERTEEALFMPPVCSSVILKSAGMYERWGARFLPVVAGLHMVEASKQLYAGVKTDGGSKVQVRGRGIFIPRPAV